MPCEVQYPVVSDYLGVRPGRGTAETTLPVCDLAGTGPLEGNLTVAYPEQHRISGFQVRPGPPVGAGPSLGVVRADSPPKRRCGGPGTWSPPADSGQIR